MSTESRVSTGDLLRDRTEIWISHEQENQGSFVVLRFPPEVILDGRRLLLLQTKWFINPIDWAPQVYVAINDYLKPYGEDINLYVMLVDLYGIVGPYETSLFSWKLWMQDGQLYEEIWPSCQRTERDRTLSKRLSPTGRGGRTSWSAWNN